jgi:hypothetical protein
LEDSTLLEDQRPSTYESTATPPVIVQTPDQELVVARQTQLETTPEWVDQTPPNTVEVPAEPVPAEAQSLKKQEWL